MGRKSTRAAARLQLRCEYCNGKGYTIVNSVTALRMKHGLSQEELGKAIGVTRATISSIELGKQAVSVNMIKSMALVLDVTEHAMYDMVAGLADETAVEAATPSPQPQEGSE